MFETLICVLVCGFAYYIKGGQMKNIFHNYDDVRGKNRVYDRLLDGKVLSTIVFGVFILAMTTFNGHTDWQLALAAAVAWLVAVAPSMGEEAGAIGGLKGAWGDYLKWMPDLEERNFLGIKFKVTEGRSYGIGKGWQRGVWMGAALAVAFDSTLFILPGLLFVPAMWLGVTINQIINKSNDWHMAELIVGGLCFGVGVSLYFA